MPEFTSTATTSRFRADLDGLRGVAIALVVVFHVFVGRVSGGVDVFLFLSGYFFLGSQLRYALRENPRLNPWWPLWRTARRLLPSLVTVLTATAVISVVVVPGLMSYDLTRQFAASLFFYQNSELAWQGADYASVSPDVTPLQHLWSISVQGQFYLATITVGMVVAWLTSRGVVAKDTARRWAVVLLGLVTVASFAFASRHGLFGTELSYYSIFSRAWEMTLGGMLALLAPRVSIPSRASGAAAATGLVMIFLTGVLIPTSLAYPGPLTLLPIGGAALIVLSNPANPVSSALASQPVTWLGSIAYPLYLWHWPLLIAVVTLGTYTTPPLVVGIGVIALSLVLAQFTHKMVEEPLKQHRKRPTAKDAPVGTALRTLKTPAGVARALGGVVIAAAATALLSLQPMWQRNVEVADAPLDPANYPGAMALHGAEAPDLAPQPHPLFASSITTPIYRDGCVVAQDQPADAMPDHECVYGDPDAETTVALVGGSHAETYGIPLDELGREHGFKVVTFIRQTCPMVFTPGQLVSEECAEWSRNVFGELVELDPDVVVSTSTRPEGGAGDASMSADTVPPEYIEVWDALSDVGLAFLGLRDNPWIFDDDGTQMDSNGCLVNGGSIEECTMPAEAAYAEVDPAAEYADKALERTMVDTSEWFCPDGMCLPAVGNITVYRDQNHISNAYSLTLAPLIWEELAPVLGMDEQG